VDGYIRRDEVTERMGVTRDARVVRGREGATRMQELARARLADEDGANKRQPLSFIVFYSTRPRASSGLT
jgi:hypothetical protein